MNAPIQLGQLQREAEMLDELCGGDERLFHDMVLGETDIDRIVSRIHEQRARDEEMLVGIKDRKAALLEREKRIKTRVDNTKALIGKTLRIARLSKLELPEVTYSVRAGKPTLQVADKDAVPLDYLKQTPSPDKTKINDAFSDADDLPNWLSWSEPSDVVTARTK